MRKNPIPSKEVQFFFDSIRASSSNRYIISAREMLELLSDPLSFGSTEYLRMISLAIWLPDEKLPKVIESHWNRLTVYAKNLIRFLIAWMNEFRGKQLDLSRRVANAAVKKVLAGSPV